MGETPLPGAESLKSGEMKSFEVNGEQVAVARVGEDLYAFGDVCTHAECSLSEGFLEGMRVVCPCHGSEFDIRTGEVLNPPAEEPVPSYQVVRQEGQVKLRL